MHNTYTILDFSFAHFSFAHPRQHIYIYIYIYPASFISLYALVNDKEEERRVKNIHQFTTNKNI
jgi:hypothetical protein